jgi:hypothetical protein
MRTMLLVLGMLLVGVPLAAQDCPWTTRAYGSAAYVVMIGDSAVAGFQRWDTALRRAVTEEAADPRRDVSIRMAVRVECPTTAPPPVEPPPVEPPVEPPDTVGPQLLLTLGNVPGTEPVWDLGPVTESGSVELCAWYVVRSVWMPERQIQWHYPMVNLTQPGPSGTHCVVMARR